MTRQKREDLNENVPEHLKIGKTHLFQRYASSELGKHVLAVYPAAGLVRNGRPK